MPMLNGVALRSQRRVHRWNESTKKLLLSSRYKKKCHIDTCWHCWKAVRCCLKTLNASNLKTGLAKRAEIFATCSPASHFSSSTTLDFTADALSYTVNIWRSKRLLSATLQLKVRKSELVDIQDTAPFLTRSTHIWLLFSSKGHMTLPFPSARP